MSIKKMTIHFTEKEQKLLDAYMKFQTVPLSVVLKDILFEEIDEYFDSALLEEAIKHNKENSRTYTTLELIEELGINLEIDDKLKEINS